jgi:hypothetical protein
MAMPLLFATGCGSGSASGTVESSSPATDVMVIASTSTTAHVPPSTDAGSSSSSTTLGPVLLDVRVEGTLPAFDEPATLWRVPAMPHDPGRVARWAPLFGFTDAEIGAAVGTRIARDTPDGQVLAISESVGRWVFVNGSAGMYADPGSCPLPTVAPSSTIAPATTVALLADQPCSDPPPPGVPDPTAAEQQARSRWTELGIDVTGTTVTVGGDEYLREVSASDELGDAAAPRLLAVIGDGGRLIRASGSLDAPVAAGSVPRVGIEEALDRFARQPPGGPAVTVPASFDGVYRVIGATAGLISSGGSWLIPTYDVSLADGRTITLLAINQSDIPID